MRPFRLLKFWLVDKCLVIVIHETVLHYSWVTEAKSQTVLFILISDWWIILGISPSGWLHRILQIIFCLLASFIMFHDVSDHSTVLFLIIEQFSYPIICQLLINERSLLLIRYEANSPINFFWSGVLLLSDHSSFTRLMPLEVSKFLGTKIMDRCQAVGVWGVLEIFLRVLFPHLVNLWRIIFMWSFYWVWLLELLIQSCLWRSLVILSC